MKIIIRFIITFLTCLVVFWKIFTPLKFIFGGGETLLTLLAILPIIVYDKLFFNIRFWHAVMICFIIGSLAYMDVQYFDNCISGLVLLLFAVCAFEHFNKTKDFQFLRWTLLTLFITLIVLAVISIPQFYSHPYLTRLLANGRGNDGVDVAELESIFMFTVSYQTIHAIPILIIPLFVVLKEGRKRIYRIVSFFCVLIFFVLVLLGNATTPLFIMLLEVVFLFIYNHEDKVANNVIKILLFSLCTLLFINKTILTDLLLTVQPFFKGSSNYVKIDEFILLINTGITSGDTDARKELYNITLDAIASNPLFPTYDVKELGKHSYLLDHLAAMGFFLFIPFAYFLISRFNFIKSRLYYKSFFVIGFFVFIFMASVKNFFCVEYALFYLPLSLYAILKSNLIKKKYE